jgi:hypothetical protein
MSTDVSGLMALASTTIPRKPANCRATSSAPCGWPNREHNVGVGQQLGKVVERTESGLLGAPQCRFASAGAQPADLVAATDQTGRHGRAHGAGMQDGEHTLADHWPTPAAAVATIIVACRPAMNGRHT